MLSRSLASVALFTMIPLAGCGGGSEGTGGAGGDAFEGVQATVIDSFDPGTGKVTTKPVAKTEWNTIQAIADGKTYDGTLDDEGNLRIAGVPEGAYDLVLVAPPADPALPSVRRSRALSAHTLVLGSSYSCRDGLVPFTKPSYFILDATLGIPFHVASDDMGNATGSPDDTLELYSRGTGTVGTVISSPGSGNGDPADGATDLAMWKIDATQVLFDASGFGVSQFEGDDLAILHAVTTDELDASEPDGSAWKAYAWKGVREAFVPKPFSLADGATVTLSGAFTAATAPIDFAFDYRGSQFNALLADAPAYNPASSYLDISVYHEPGAPEPATGAFATLFDVLLHPLEVFDDPLCNADTCDASCTNNCESPSHFVLPGDKARTFSFGDPIDGGQRLLSVVLYFRSSATALLPDTTPQNLNGYVSLVIPLDEASGKPIVPPVGLPRNVTVNGAPAPASAITSGVGTSPTIAFQAPSIGAPDRYRVIAIDVGDLTQSDGGVSRQRNIASFEISGTSVTVPAGTLQSGRNYYFQVVAEQNDVDPAKPFRHARHTAVAATYTGLVTP